MRGIKKKKQKKSDDDYEAANNNTKENTQQRKKDTKIQIERERECVCVCVCARLATEGSLLHFLPLFSYFLYLFWLLFLLITYQSIFCFCCSSQLCLPQSKISLILLRETQSSLPLAYPKAKTTSFFFCHLRKAKLTVGCAVIIFCCINRNPPPKTSSQQNLPAMAAIPESYLEK